MLINTYKGEVTSPYVALDTETHTYVDGVLLTEAEISNLIMKTDETGKRIHDQAWLREHVTVKAWSYSIYSPDGFAVCETFEEFVSFLSRYRVKYGWWYNAPFDFSIIDWEALTSGWSHVEKAKKPYEYSELCSEYGVRYSMDMILPYDNETSFNKRSKRASAHVRFYDLRNLLKGGLGALLETFDVKDDEGTPIRKGKMDYQSASSETLTESDAMYILDDVRGLWWLVQTFGRRLLKQYGVDIISGRPEVLTASGLAKKLLLRKMYPYAINDRARNKLYRRYHPMTLELDRYWRESALLQGGLVMLNPAVRGRHLYNVRMFRFDYNSHYPAIMHGMPDIRGFPTVYDGVREKSPEQVRIFEISSLCAVLKKGYIPAWLNPITRKVDDEVTVYPQRDRPICLFDFELDELKLWYDFIECKIERTWIYRAVPCVGFVEYVDEMYKGKQEASAINDKIMKEIMKLLLNGTSGKFSQNPNHKRTSREITENHVQLVHHEAYIDEAEIMNIVQGAYITAMGRTILRQSCRAVAKENGRTVSDCIAYTDTDSIHTNVHFSQTDSLKLGWLKQENKKPITEAFFCAPKAYAEIEGTEAKFHSKGVRVECLEKAWRNGDNLAQIYEPGRLYQSLSAMNVRGGKALLALPKAVCKKAKEITEEDELYW